MSAASPTLVETPGQAAAVQGFWKRFVGMILRPSATLAGLTEPDAWFWPSIMLLVGYVLFYIPIGIGMARYTSLMMTQLFTPATGQQVPPSVAATTATMRSVMPLVNIFSAMLQVPIYVAISWGTRTVIFYGLSQVLGGAKARWGQVVAMVGWAWVPLFLQYVLLGIGMLASPRLFATFMFIPDPKHPIPAEAVMRFRWLIMGLRELSPFVLWNLYLCMLGVRQVFQLPRWKAALVVLLPMVLYVLFEVGMLLLANSMMKAFGGPNGPVMPGR